MFNEDNNSTVPDQSVTLDELEIEDGRIAGNMTGVIRRGRRFMFFGRRSNHSTERASRRGRRLNHSAERANRSARRASRRQAPTIRSSKSSSFSTLRT
jgi:hypothetical protein